MCGIIGIISEEDVSSSIYESLTVIQHRGQDAAGMATLEDGKLHVRKQIGLVREVFRAQHIKNLKGKMGIGHVRYPTAGGVTREFSQPLYVNSPYGISLVHNGNLTNSKQLGNELFHAEMRDLQTDSDSEVLLNIFAHELGKQREIYPSEKHIFKAVAKTHIRCDGAYAVLALINGHGMLAFRDSNGIRPLSIGVRKGKSRDDYIISSEDALYTPLGFEKLRDVEPGEAIYIDKNGTMFSQQCSDDPKRRPCIFEYVYFSRPDSKIDEISVYKSRMRMGTKLARQIKKIRPYHDIDVVIPIPDSSVTAAHQLAVDLDVPYREGFVKNRYIGRTFIMPYQEERKKSVRRKLNILDLEFEGKNVLLVDDSIVRGTTSKKIIEMAREAGAKKVYFASAAPAIKYQNLYGIDMPATSELIASNKSHDEVALEINADWLIYQTLEDLIDSVREGNPEIKEFETSIFTGDYFTPLIENYLEELEISRKDELKMQREKAQAKH